MENKNLIKFSFLLSGGEEITRTMELRGTDSVEFLGIRRYSDRYVIEIGPHTVDLPANLMKDFVERILLLYPEDETLRDIVDGLAISKPWLFERR